MGLAHLHFAFRDRPDRLVKIDLAPFHLAHFARALEKMGCEFQSRHYGRITLIIVNGAQQPAKYDGISDRRKVLYLRDCKRADQQLCRIPISARGRDGIAEDAADK